MNEVARIGSADGVPPTLYDIELEQQVLGGIFYDNRTLHDVSDVLEPAHFYDPVHADIYRLAQQRGAAGLKVTPITLRASLSAHPGLKELGGPRYLFSLMNVALSGGMSREYAKMVRDLAYRRAIFRSAAHLQAEIAGGGQVSKHIDELLTLSADAAPTERPYQSMTVAATEALRRASGAYAGEPVGIPWGFKALDKLLGTMEPADMIVVGGAPSMGKSSIGMSLAQKAAASGAGVCIVSLEMAEHSLAARLISAQANVPYTAFRTGNIQDETAMRKIVEATRVVADLPIFITSPEVKTPSGILGAVQAARAQLASEGVKLGLVVIDYLQLIEAPGRSTYEVVSNASTSSKQLAKVLGLPVIALAQLSRGLSDRDDKRPKLNDLRDSGKIEQDADFVLFVHRDSYYLQREGPPKGKNPKDSEDLKAEWEYTLSRARNRVNLIVAKNRHGPIEQVELGIHMPTNRVWDIGEEPAIEGFA